MIVMLNVLSLKVIHLGKWHSNSISGMKLPKLNENLFALVIHKNIFNTWEDFFNLLLYLNVFYDKIKLGRNK